MDGAIGQTDKNKTEDWMHGWKLNEMWNWTIVGDVENEDEILEWLLSQLEKDEIEDVTDEMLDRLIKDGKTLAVLFCKIFHNHLYNYYLYTTIFLLLVFLSI